MSLDVEINDLKFKNPIIVGSAGYVEDENGIRRFIKKGYGGVVTKSTSKESLPGAPPPRVFWYNPYSKSYLDAHEAHRNPGIKIMAESVKACKDLADKENCHLIGSVSCSSVEEAVYVATEFEKAGVSAVEIDMQCPGVGEILGPEYATRGGVYWSDVKHPERSVELIRAVKAALHVPLWPKIVTKALYANGEIILKECKPDGFAFMGFTFPTSPLGLAVDIESGNPIFSGNTQLYINNKRKFRPSCGCVPELPTTVLATALIKKKLNVPLLPSGGIARGFDVIQSMMVGADAVEVCSAVYRDTDVIDSILREMKWYMSKKGISSLREILGTSLDHIPFDLMEIPAF